MYLIAACNYMRGVERWVRTIPALGPEIQPVLCMYEPHFDVPEYFQVLKEYRAFPGHDQKYLPLLPFVEEHPDEFFLVTDTCDVVFQAPVKRTSGLWAELSWEGRNYCDVPYWQDALRGEFEKLKDTPVYNAGIYIMRGDKLAQCWRRIESLSGTTTNVVDQLGLCLFLQEQHTGFCQNPGLLNLYDRIGDADIRGKKFHSVKDSSLFSAVHGNGSTKTLLDMVVPI